MSKKIDIRKQIKIDEDAHLTLCKLKHELYGKNFSDTIREAYYKIEHLERVYKEVSLNYALYGSIIHKHLNKQPLNHAEIELIKHWIPQSKVEINA